MVKRQTVWLSTMMVFSLMLIGYYTLGTPPVPNTNTAQGGGHGVTTVGGAGATVPASISGKGHGKSTGTVTTSANSILSGQSPSDWFVQASLDQSQSQSKVIQTLQQTLTNPKVSQQVASHAYTELTAIQTQAEQASRIHDLLVGQYPDSLVVFNPKNQVHVWVETQSLSPTAAVKVINLVAQTLGIQSNQVTVSPHA
ncbi:MAG: SpoIIIAH-like family protein [Bacilli bacterium]